MKRKYFWESDRFQRWLPFLTLSVVFLSMLLMAMITVNKDSDIGAHINEANAWMDGKTKSIYPGFYVLFGLFSRVLFFPDKLAAASAMAVSVLLCAVVVYGITRCVMGDKLKEWERWLIVFFMAFFGPLWFPQFGKRYYNGRGSFNPWHNPTNNCVKFLALLVFFLFVYSFFYMKKDEKVTVLGQKVGKGTVDLVLCVCTVLSLLIKPSFVQVFGPMLIIVFVMDLLDRRRNLLTYVREGLPYVPAAAIILWQAVAAFFSGGGSGESTVEIAFAEVWKNSTPYVGLSVLAVAAFPLFVTLFCEKNLLKNKMQLCAWIFYAVGLAEALLLAETGPRRYHGNFGWGYGLAIGILFLSSIFTYLRYVKVHREETSMKERAKRWFGFGTLLFHLGEGGAYYLALLVLPSQCF